MTEFDPLTGDPLPKTQDVAAVTTDSTPDLTSLDTMPSEALRDLIRLVGGAIWGYALMDDTQKAEAARLKLYNLGMSSNEVSKVVPALDKWFDRTSGKAPQSVVMDVKDSRLDKLPIDQLIRLAAMLDEPVIISALPSSST